MRENCVIGNVISVDGFKINILVNDESDVEIYHYDGNLYPGISIGGYLGIIRGSKKLVVRIEKEYLDDVLNDNKRHEYLRGRFSRILEVSIIGTISNCKFEYGIKKFPKIYNEVVLLTNDEIQCVLQNNASNTVNTISIGESLINNVPIQLPWDKIFNTHIGIFGNTGSGKSNTLAKLYTELFNLEKYTILENFSNKSKFFLIDFNGEYTKDDILRKNKKVIKLNTRTNTSDKLPLTSEIFWDIETLSILYSATEKTQKPFLQKAVDFFLDKDNNISTDKIIDGMCSAFWNIFKQNNTKETLSFLNKNMNIIGYNTNEIYKHNGDNIPKVSWLDYLWNNTTKTYYLGDDYISNKKENDIRIQRDEFKKLLECDSLIENINNLSITNKLRIAVNCQLIYSLSFGQVNYEHISPLIRRIEARSKAIEKTILICNDKIGWDVLNIISLRNCNSETKKIIPLLIAKQLYEEHKCNLSEEYKITNTIHLIIDEAHNILSGQSVREEESWKDYRLEVFEEIIKEGRKFGFYITLASQRPYDISPTIVSQLHNYFIHRLVNEHDLKMISNTVNSLDSISKNRIPTLSPGQCVVTGTSFEMPILIQVEKLDRKKSPTSENADLVDLWSK